MTSAQVVETSVTNNSSFQNYTHPDDHTIRTTEFNYYLYQGCSLITYETYACIGTCKVYRCKIIKCSKVIVKVLA